MRYIIQVINTETQSVLYVTHDYITVSKSKALRFDTYDQAQAIVDRVKQSLKLEYAIEEVAE